MTSTQIEACEKLFSEKLQAYLSENPSAYDVTFSVGPTKERVSAVKLILVASSPVFRKLFEENWDMAVVQNNEGIALPDIDASAFEIFLRLLPSEHINVEELQKLELTADQILSLVSISKQFGMSTMQRVFEEMSQPFFKHFDTYASTLEFLTLSSKNLATILASDRVRLKEIDIFKFACRWAEHQCSKLKTTLDLTSLREVLGESLKEIRFPLMTFEEFGRVVSPREILFADERLKIFEFIALPPDERNSCDETLLGFKTIPRIKSAPKSGNPTESLNSERSVLRLFTNPVFVSSPSSVSNERASSYLGFNVDKKIELVGVGFAGPAHSNGEFNVDVELSVLMNSNHIPCGRTQRIIQANHRINFYFFFDRPIICNPGPNPRLFYYYIDFTLKGPNLQLVDISKQKEIKGNVMLNKMQDGVSFDFEIVSSQIVALLFRKLE